MPDLPEQAGFLDPDYRSHDRPRADAVQLGDALQTGIALLGLAVEVLEQGCNDAGVISAQAGREARRLQGKKRIDRHHRHGHSLRQQP